MFQSPAGSTVFAMTTTTRNPFHELSAVKAQYEKTLGWPVSVDAGYGRLVMHVGGRIDAIILPVRLAERALAELRFAMLDGPVAAAPGGQWLTFLTTRTAAANPALPLELRNARAQLIPCGGQIIMPRSLTAQDIPRDWRWVVAPRPHRALPPWCAVVSAARRAVRW